MSDFVLFEPTFSEARRVGAPRNIASRAERGELTRFFEIRSNLFKNVHHFGNREMVGGSAGCARLRRQRCKGKIQICREPPEKEGRKTQKF